MILNKLDCAINTGNTGVSDCALDIKALAGAILVPNSFEIPATVADAAAALALLQDAAKADVAAERIYPLPGVFNFTDNTEDATYQTGSTGVQTFVRDGKYDWTIQFTQGGYCLLQEIQKFNSSNKSLLFFDEAGVLFGTRSSTGGLKGIPLNVFHAAPWKANDGSNVAQYMYRVNFNPGYVNTGGLTFIKFGLGEIASLQGLLNIGLTQLAPRVAGLMEIGANVSCGGADLFDLYSVELADALLWKASTAGKDVTITSVAANSNLRGWSVTMSTSDPDYSASGDVLVSLAPPSALSAAGVDGYVGIPKIIKTT